MLHSVRQDHGHTLLEENQPTIYEDEYYLGLITYGKCVFWVRDQKVIVSKGESILIPRGASFYWKTIPSTMHSKYTLTFGVTSDFPRMLPILRSDQHVHSKLGRYEMIYEKIKELTEQWNEKIPYYEVYGSALLTEILTLWNRELDLGLITPERHKLVERMKKYIQDHYREKITKHHLGDVIQRSPNYAATLFSNVTGQTISEYTHSLRIKTAIYMLTESELTIGEISEFVGYSEVSYFNKNFKRMTGKMPSEYLEERPSRII
jgi:AraC family transcriptional regulator of arabinose operon